jgi:hypothetical protein
MLLKTNTSARRGQRGRGAPERPGKQPESDQAPPLPNLARSIPSS